MAEFDEKLNALLSDPNSMAQIMQLAQSLSGGGQQAAPQSAPPPPAYAPPAGGDFFGPPQGGFSPPASGFGGGENPLSSLLGGLDPKLLTRLLPLAQELGAAQNTNSRALLYALRPYLKAERQAKIERALQLARVVHVGRKFFSSWEG